MTPVVTPLGGLFGVLMLHSTLAIDSQAEADADRIRAQGAADAERIRGEGTRDAAATIQTSDVAVALAKIRETGFALGDNAKMFFGADAGHVGALLSNPQITR